MPWLAKSNRPDVMAHIQVHLSAVLSNNAIYRWQELKSNQKNPYFSSAYTNPTMNSSLNCTFMFNVARILKYFFFGLFSDIFFLCYFYTSNLFCFLFISLSDIFVGFCPSLRELSPWESLQQGFSPMVVRFLKQLQTSAFQQASPNVNTIFIPILHFPSEPATTTSLWLAYKCPVCKQKGSIRVRESFSVTGGTYPLNRSHKQSSFHCADNYMVSFSWEMSGLSPQVAKWLYFLHREQLLPKA